MKWLFIAISAYWFITGVQVEPDNEIETLIRYALSGIYIVGASIIAKLEGRK